MNSPEFRRCDTILNYATNTGRKVTFTNVKEMLHTVLGDCIVVRAGIAFSNAKIAEVVAASHRVNNAGSIIGKAKPDSAPVILTPTC
ncbi:MAG: hypothetical protein ABGY95_02675 [Rubritalea sp.]|uniref:hypothetical protein n=1 Tax=Rubritalea sp. TaxID=2109375 RepID=UPI0032428CD6